MFVPGRRFGAMWCGEDVSFCVRAAAAGFPIHVHAGVRTTHHKAVWVSEPHYFEQLGVPLATEETAVLVPVLSNVRTAFW